MAETKKNQDDAGTAERTPIEGEGVTPDVDGPPETVAPVRYRSGQKAPGRLYGVRGPDGKVTPTGGGGRQEPDPGQRGVLLAAEGTVLSERTAKLLNG